jgi:hypothetical protein
VIKVVKLDARYRGFAIYSHRIHARERKYGEPTLEDKIRFIRLREWFFNTFGQGVEVEWALDPYYGEDESRVPKWAWDSDLNLYIGEETLTVFALSRDRLDQELESL